MKPITRLAIIAIYTIISGCSSIIGSINKEPIETSSNERTFGQWMDDQTTETIAAVNINKADLGFKNSRIKAISFNGVLLLIGQVSERKLIKLASDTAKDITQLKQVHNELTVGPNASLLTQSHDSWLTARIKTSIISSTDLVADKIKVITEQGTVYLMGLVTTNEAKIAVDIGRKIPGVKKIIKVFEYIPDTTKNI